MEKTPAAIDELIRAVGTLAEVPEVEALIELVRQQQQQLEAQQQQIEKLKDELSKLKHRGSHNSSVPPSKDLLHKTSLKDARKPGEKRGPKYDHPGSTRNGFGQANQVMRLSLETFPVCGRGVTLVEQAPLKVQQVAELVEQPIEIWEYQRPKYYCDECGWSGYAPLPWGVKEGFSYGAKLSSIVGWLGYGGNKTRQKQEPGIRCVDETTYLIDGIKHWLWVATSDHVCVLLLAPTHAAAELQQLLGEQFEGMRGKAWKMRAAFLGYLLGHNNYLCCIRLPSFSLRQLQLSSDCFSAYNPQTATAFQKCLTHLERDPKALSTSRNACNRDFSARVSHLLTLARQAFCDYHTEQLSSSQLQQQRLQLESQLQAVLDTPPASGWPADAQRLKQRLQKYWSDWFTFLSHPEVKPDNNDAERALRPVVVHRKVSGTARSDWGGFLCRSNVQFFGNHALAGSQCGGSTD